MALQAVHLALAALAGCGSSWVSQVFLIEKKTPQKPKFEGGWGGSCWTPWSSVAADAASKNRLFSRCARHQVTNQDLLSLH